MGAMLDLNTGVTYVHTKMGNFNAGFIAFDDGRTHSFRGHLAARMSWPGGLGPFIEAKLLHEFEGDSRIRVASGTLFDQLDSRGRGTWGRIEGGLAGDADGGPLLSAWADVGDVRGWGFRAGYRFGGHAAPPPVEPMAAPPPPPATQTCPDGSVIAVTSACPAPPPPPPPPPVERGERGQ